MQIIRTSFAAEGASNERLRDYVVNRDRFTEWAVWYRDRLWNEGSRDDERCGSTDRVNSIYVLRNYLVQTAIESAQQKDATAVDRLFTLLQDPFNDQFSMDAYVLPPPNWGKHLSVSRSS